MTVRIWIHHLYILTDLVLLSKLWMSQRPLPLRCPTLNHPNSSSFFSPRIPCPLESSFLFLLFSYLVISYIRHLVQLVKLLVFFKFSILRDFIYTRSENIFLSKIIYLLCIDLRKVHISHPNITTGRMRVQYKWIMRFFDIILAFNNLFSP